MKTDRFMQGILIQDDADIYNYISLSKSRKSRTVVLRLKRLKQNFKNLRYYASQLDKQRGDMAVFSKKMVRGDVDDAINDVWERLRKS